MEKIMNIGKKILVILAISAAIIVVGLAGRLDSDEYIEVNSTPKVHMSYYYEN